MLRSSSTGGRPLEQTTQHSDHTFAGDTTAVDDAVGRRPGGRGLRVHQGTDARGSVPAGRQAAGPGLRRGARHQPPPGDGGPAATGQGQPRRDHSAGGLRGGRRSARGHRRFLPVLRGGRGRDGGTGGGAVHGRRGAAPEAAVGDHRCTAEAGHLARDAGQEVPHAEPRSARPGPRDGAVAAAGARHRPAVGSQRLLHQHGRCRRAVRAAPAGGPPRTRADLRGDRPPRTPPAPAARWKHTS